MSMGELLNIEPRDLKFPFELKKQISCSLQVSNKTDYHVAFKVKTTNVMKYCVRPNKGIMLPRSTSDIIVTMQAQKKAPANMQCKDKFLFQSVKVNEQATTSKNLSLEIFNKEAGHVVEECKLGVVYVSPPQPPSSIQEGSDGNFSIAELSLSTRSFADSLEPQDKSSEVKATNVKKYCVLPNIGIMLPRSTSDIIGAPSNHFLNIEPRDLKFPFELKKQTPCVLQVSNKTDHHVAFKVKTTNVKKYCVRPNIGIMLPRSTSDIIVTMQAQKEAPADMQCKDKFLFQSVKVNEGVTIKNLSREMFNKEAGHVVEECKLGVVYVSPPQPPSPVQEGSDGNFSTAELSLTEALIPKLTGRKITQFNKTTSLVRKWNF